MAHITLLKSHIGKKTTVIMKNLLVLFLLIFCTFSNAQSFNYEQRELLLYFEDSDNDLIGIINEQLLPEDRIIEKWISPFTNTRLWYFPTFPIEFELEYDNVPSVIYEFTDIIDANEDMVKIKRNGGPGGNGGGSELVPMGSYEIESIDFANDYNISCIDDFSLVIDNGQYPVKVSIVDSGLNFDEEGVSEYPFNPIVTTNKAYNGFSTLPQAWDLNGHGTHILGTVNRIARYNNPIGETSIQFDVRRILDQNNSGNLGDLILAIEEAILEGSQIINLSLGYNGSGENNYFLEKIKDLVEAKNILLVISAGNNASNVEMPQWNDGLLQVERTLPAALQSPNIITVGSSNCLGKLSQFSNYSDSKVDITAPGEEIVGFNKDGEVVKITGTSQATAIVSGVATSLATHMENFDAPSIKCAIVGSAEYSLPLNGFIVSSGVLDAEGALAYLFNRCYGADTRTSIANDRNISVYPNPFSNQFSLKLNKGQNQVTLVDIFGKVVYRNSIDAQIDGQELLIDKVLNGNLFVISVTDEHGITQSQKVIKY